MGKVWLLVLSLGCGRAGPPAALATPVEEPPVPDPIDWRTDAASIAAFGDFSCHGWSIAGVFPHEPSNVHLAGTRLYSRHIDPTGLSMIMDRPVGADVVDVATGLGGGCPVTMTRSMGSGPG